MKKELLLAFLGLGVIQISIPQSVNASEQKNEKTEKTLFKWVDSSGKIHFSDRPPALDEKPKSESKIKMRSGAETQATGSSEAKSEKKAQDDEKPSAEAEKKESDRKAKECDAANQAVAQLKSGTKMYVLDKAGERSYLDEKQVAERLQKAEEAAKILCSK